MTEGESGVHPHVFKPRARLLLLLGDQLIRDPGIAVFELVKNGYDADASGVTVTLSRIDRADVAAISVTDDGSGMSLDTVVNVWLEPGTDYRGEQRSGKSPHTPRFHRLPLGEKGIGRFAAGKLGRRIEMVTRAAGEPEVVVRINWDDLGSERYLHDAPVDVSTREPEMFQGNRTGTTLMISSLRESWTRGMVRSLNRAITSICSPFDAPESFVATLVLEPDPGSWLAGLPTVQDILDQALFVATGVVRDGQIVYDYEFKPPPGLDRVEGRSAHVQVAVPPLPSGPESARDGTSLSDYRVGAVGFRLHAYDRDPQVLAFSSIERKSLREYLDSNGGIRVYRDGVRVFDYGEPGDDWLNLGGRRVNVPAQRLSNNLVIGAVSLDLASSQDLVEKTNREGFVENAAFRQFQHAVSAVVANVETERNLDKLRIRKAYAKGRAKEPVLDALDELRGHLTQRGLNGELSRLLDEIERQFRDTRDVLLTAAGAGLGLIVVIHEVERGVADLRRAIDRNVAPADLRTLAQHVAEVIEGLTFVTRRSGRSIESASALARQALFNTTFRLRAHGIQVVNGFDDGQDFKVRCSRRLVVATLMNLIDNAIYWLDVKAGDRKVIYIGPSRDLTGGPAIVVADSGPGFADPPELLVQAMVSRKPDGMGIGLHLADEVMRADGGRLEFPAPGEVSLPADVSGAVLALRFGGEES